MLVATRTIHGNLIWLSIHGAIVLCQVLQIKINIKAMRYAMRYVIQCCVQSERNVAWGALPVSLQ